MIAAEQGFVHVAAAVEGGYFGARHRLLCYEYGYGERGFETNGSSTFFRENVEKCREKQELRMVGLVELADGQRFVLLLQMLEV